MKTKRIIKDQKGGALIEFAIVLPLLVLLAFGIIEFGLLLYDQAVITNASREGARAGITGLNDIAIEAIAENYCQNRLITFGNNVPDALPPVKGDENGNGTLGESGESLTVTVEYDYSFLVSQLFGLGQTKKLRAQTVMFME